MSSPLNPEMNDMQPPPKRQRILPEGAVASPRSIHGKSVDASASSSLSPGSSTGPLADGGPIFTNVQEIDGCSSIESALRVPARILFRQVGGDRTVPGGASKSNENSGSKNINSNQKSRKRLRPLLSRQEAEQFLRVTLLAQEIDVLVDLSETVLSRRQFARRFRRDVLMQRESEAKDPKDHPWKNPWLATLGPILDVLEKRQSNLSNEHQFPNQQRTFQGDILHHIHNELTRLYHALQACGVFELERSAEQNRSLVASLTDILGYSLDDDGQNDENDNKRTFAVRNLAREKQSLSRLQDLLAKRVRSLLVVLCHSRTRLTTESNDASDDGAKEGADVDNGSNTLNDRKQILFDEQLSSSSDDGDIDNTASNANTVRMEKASPKEENDVGNDEESSILSLEEILIPLEIVCNELFDEAGEERALSTVVTRNHNQNNDVSNHSCDRLENEKILGSPELTPKEKQSQIQQEEEIPDRTTKESATPTATSMITNLSVPASTVEDPDPMTRVTLEASQRTVGAAATIMSLAGKDRQDLDEQEKETSQPATWEETYDPDTTITLEPEASQRAVGAATTMMALATKTGLDFTSQKKRALEQDDLHINGKRKAGTNNIVNRNIPHTQQHHGNDDGSFIDDPPSDGEDERDETANKDEAASSKNANGSAGIFDVVDVLTPQSQS